MTRPKKLILFINVIGGLAVLASYIWGIVGKPELIQYLWGNTPKGIIPYFYVNMLLATTGYLTFSAYIIFSFDPTRSRINTKAGYNGLVVLYLLILIPSALWMPLSLIMLEHPSELIWFLIRLVLLLTGVGGLGMLSALFSITPRSKFLLLSLIGCIFFCLQVCIFDAFIWPAFFVTP